MNYKFIDRAAVNILLFWVATKVVKKVLDIPEKPFIVINVVDKESKKEYGKPDYDTSDFDKQEEVIMTIDNVGTE